MKKITVMGGGTGTFVVLNGLKQYPINLAAIVNMMDSGGSTGRLRVQLGVLPPGDIRQCFVALSEAPDFWRKLFLYRFESGDLGGHNFGNVFLSALEKISLNYDEALKTLGYVLKTKGQVYPVTYEKTHLCVTYMNGVTIKGEGKIDENNKEESRIQKAYLEPNVKANKKALDRIMNSDSLIIGPGDLYTSIIPLFLVKGMSAAIQKTKAKIFYIVNLMTKTGQTTRYSAKQHVSDIETYLKRKVDVIVVHKGRISPSIVNWYTSHHEQRVCDNLINDSRVVRGDIADNTYVKKGLSDALSRSILRHDSGKLAKYLSKLV